MLCRSKGGKEEARGRGPLLSPPFCPKRKDTPIAKGSRDSECTATESYSQVSQTHAEGLQLQHRVTQSFDSIQACYDAFLMCRSVDGLVQQFGDFLP